jgi:hypothetical protein
MGARGFDLLTGLLHEEGVMGFVGAQCREFFAKEGLAMRILIFACFGLNGSS